MLGVLVAVILAVPLLAETESATVGRALMAPAILAVCLLAVGDERAVRRPIVALVAAGIAGDLACEFYHPPSLVMLTRATFICVAGIVVFVLVRRILEAPRITARTLLGGVCAYLLLGFLFSGLYGLLEYAQPGSFVRGGTPVSELAGAEPTLGRYPHFNYFSLVTLTTLGYGDIVPARALGGTVATLEAIVGQLYIAIFVAGLVGLHLADRRRG